MADGIARLMKGGGVVLREGVFKISIKTDYGKVVWTSTPLETYNSMLAEGTVAHSRPQELY